IGGRTVAAGSRAATAARSIDGPTNTTTTSSEFALPSGGSIGTRYLRAALAHRGDEGDMTAHHQSREARHRAPVMLLSPARSHSSVVAAMIGGHPQLYGFPELILFDYATVGERLDAPPRIGKRPPGYYPFNGLVRALAQLHDGDQQPESIAAAKQWVAAHRDSSGAAVFDHLLDLVAPLIGVEKSPETVNGEEQLHRTLSAYPDARFIHLARHPVPAARSLQVRWLTFNRPEVFALSWLNQHRRISAFCAELPADQWI